MNAYLKKKPTLRDNRLAVKRWFVSTTCRAMLLGCIALFGILYLFKVNAVSTQGFVINDLEGEIVELERENKRLGVQVASHRSMKSIEERLQGMEFVAVDDVTYITSVGTAVARR